MEGIHVTRPKRAPATSGTRATRSRRMCYARRARTASRTAPSRRFQEQARARSRRAATTAQPLERTRGLVDVGRGPQASAAIQAAIEVKGSTSKRHRAEREHDSPAKRGDQPRTRQRGETEAARHQELEGAEETPACRRWRHFIDVADGDRQSAANCEPCSARNSDELADSCSPSHRLSPSRLIDQHEPLEHWKAPVTARQASRTGSRQGTARRSQPR